MHARPATRASARSSRKMIYPSRICPPYNSHPPRISTGRSGSTGKRPEGRTCISEAAQLSDGGDGGGGGPAGAAALAAAGESLAVPLRARHPTPPDMQDGAAVHQPHCRHCSGWVGLKQQASPPRVDRLNGSASRWPAGAGALACSSPVWAAAKTTTMETALAQAQAAVAVVTWRGEGGKGERKVRL